MGIDSSLDLKRKINELCLTACKKRVSPQTGFVHYCYEAKYENAHDTIPLKENLSFALSLLRSKNQENVLFAKDLLGKLLAFEKEGFFPTYLHEFPKPSRPSNTLYCAVFLHLALADFGLILGSELKNQLQSCIARIINVLDKETLHFSHKAILQAIKGEKLDPIIKGVLNAEEAADILLAIQIAKDPSYSLYIDKVLKAYAKDLGLYLGSSLVYYEKYQLELNLVDLFLAEFSLEFPFRILQDHPVHMLASLVYPFEKESKEYGYYHSKTEGTKTCTLFFGDKETIYSLQIEAKNTELSWKKEQDGIAVRIPISDIEDADYSEVLCYVSNLPGVNIYIGEQKATIFKLNETVAVVTPAGRMSLQWSCSDLDSKYLGHIMKGNRPTQRCIKGENAFKSFDYIIGMRAIQKSAHPILELKIKLCDLSGWLIV